MVAASPAETHANAASLAAFAALAASALAALSSPLGFFAPLLHSASSAASCHRHARTMWMEEVRY